MKKILFAILSILIICTEANADTISSVTGDILQDSSVSLSGTFSSKSSSAPLIWDNFENGTNGSDLDTNDWVYYPDGQQSATYSNVRSTSGSLSAYNNPNYTGASADNTFGTVYQTFTASDKVYVSYYIRTDIDGSDSANCKWTRINSDDGSELWMYTSARMTIQSWFPASGNDGKPYTEYDNGAIATEDYITEIPLEDTWYRVEMYIELSTAGIADGKAWSRFDNTLMMNDENVVTRASGESFQISSILLGLMATSLSSTADFDIYIDDVYVDNTEQRVEIGNASTYSSCTHREIQIPTAWATDEITVTVNQGSFANGTNAFLFVIDSDGVASTGYPITIGSDGGGGDPDPVDPDGVYTPSTTSYISGNGTLNCSITRN